MSHYRIPKQVEMRPAKNDNYVPGVSDFSSIMSLTAKESRILAGVTLCDKERFNLIVDKASAITQQIRVAKNKLKEKQRWDTH